MNGNALVVHGGGPTAVMNASLYGIIEEARAGGRIDKVYAAMGGTAGILNEDLLDLFQFPEERLRLLPAILAGREALNAALDQDGGVMIGFIRDETEDGSYRMHVERIPIEEVMMYERILPDSYINGRGNDVTQEFVDWCRPLIGPELRDFIDFAEERKKI